jgi:hypothetical protein
VILWQQILYELDKLVSFDTIIPGNISDGSGIYNKHHLKGNDIGINFINASNSGSHICWVINQFTASAYSNTGTNTRFCHKINRHRIGTISGGLLDRWPASSFRR